MVASGPFDVVDMKAEKARAHAFEMSPVADEAEVLLNLGVAGIMPIDHGRIAELFEEGVEIRFEGYFLERLAIFDAELEAAGFGFVDDPGDQFVSVLQVAF